MTLYEKCMLGISGFAAVGGLTVSIMFGGMIGDIKDTAASVERAVVTIQEIATTGPEAFKEVGDGINEGATKAGEGIGNASAGVINSIKGALNNEKD